MRVDVFCHLSNSNQSGSRRGMKRGDIMAKFHCEGEGSTCRGLILEPQLTVFSLFISSDMFGSELKSWMKHSKSFCCEIMYFFVFRNFHELVSFSHYINCTRKIEG